MYIAKYNLYCFFKESENAVPIKNPNVKAVGDEEFVTEKMQGGRVDVLRRVDRARSSGLRNELKYNLKIP